MEHLGQIQWKYSDRPAASAVTLSLRHSTSYEEIISLIETLHRESLEIISRLTDLNGECRTPDGVAMTTWKWLRAMVEHEVHHRGQIYIYLALLEVPTPPLYGLTSEQVTELSTRT